MSANILLVEDNAVNADMLSRRLIKRGYTVTVATDGLQGVECAGAMQPDLILMDVSLPTIDGWEATRRLKADPATAHIPIIALSAASEAREDARACGCDGFLAKPCQPDLLWWEIRALLDPPG